MTARQYNRLRKWKTRCRKAYAAGLLDGKEARHEGRARPSDRMEYDIKVYIRRRMRRGQDVTNHGIARAKGRLDGWDMADKDIRDSDLEEVVQTALASGFDEVERFANWGVA